MNTVAVKSNSRKVAAQTIINVDINIEKTARTSKWTAILSCKGKELALNGKGKASEKPFRNALMAAVREIKNPNAFLVITHNVADFQAWFWKTPQATQTLTKLTGFRVTCRLAK